MKVINNKKIKLEKSLNKLDKFTIKFCKTISPLKYVLISGYVSILFGRSRSSEDIDIFIPKITYKEFLFVHKKLLKKKFWCINGDDKKELYSLLCDGHSIRYADFPKSIPNMEIKFVKTPLDFHTLKERIEVVIGKEKLFIGPLELQIAYKEEVLRSEKDIEDALHLRKVLEEHINLNSIKSYKRLIKDENRRTNGKKH